MEGEILKLKNIFAYVSALTFVAGLLLLSEPARAGDMTICSRMKNKVSYAMVWDEGIPVFATIWKASGWFVLDSGQCRTVLVTDSRQELYLSVVEILPSGKGQLLAPRLDNREIVQSGFRGIEIPFCVRKEPFQRTAKKLKELQQCPAGYYQQLFNFLMFSAKRVNYTLRLN